MQTTYDAAEKLVEDYPWLKLYERALVSLILEEADHWHAHFQKSDDSTTYAYAIERTHELMGGWIDQAAEYQVDLDDFDDVLRFMASRRRPFVWTILIAMHQLRK